MKTFIFLLTAVTLSSVLQGAPLTVADGKKSDYQIVIPESCGNAQVDGYVALGGKVIQTALRKATGASVPLVTESKKIPGKPAIYVGNTKAAAKAGLSSAKFVNWEHAIAVKGKDIFCYGKDSGNPYKTSDMFPALKYPKYFVHYVNGSLKAACTFVQKFVNTRFVIPKFNAYGEHEGVRTLPMKKVTVPEKFSYRQKVRFTQQSDMGGILYSIANNFVWAPGEGYMVHYHAFAIPQDKYYKTNPEYFALLNGKRLYHQKTATYEARPQYCLSNPQVQELIYKNALKRADLGYKVVEFGQSDGFIGCQCEPCKKMYNTPHWGEKLWRLHADMAARIEKDRPGVIPAIACYGPTHMIPQTLKKFPSKKMIIDVAPATKKLIEGWKKFNVTGMAAWTYYFGAYKASSYAPACDFDYLQKEIAWMHTTPVTYFYNCGIGVAPALNGPWVYAYGQFCGDPKTDWRKMLKEYCLFAFGAKAAKPMEEFFLILDERSKLFPPDQNDDFNDFNRKRKTADEVWGKRYTPAILAKLEKAFEAARKNWIVSDHTKRLEKEFAYLLLTAQVNNAALKLQDNDTKANRNALADAIEKREAYFKTLDVRNGRVYGVFGTPSLHHLRIGGSMGGIFQGAFSSDPKVLRQNINSVELIKVKDFADPSWAKIKEEKLVPLKNAPAVNASFKMAYTDDALLLLCTAPLAKMPETRSIPRDSSALWQEAVWELFIGAGRERQQLVFSAVKNSAFDSIISAYDKGNPRWNGHWTHKDTVQNGVWRSEVTIYFKNAIGKKPAAGENWFMQVAFSAPGAQALYTWNIPLSGRFADPSGFGQVRFGKRPLERKVDISNFRNKAIWHASSPKVKMEYVKVDGKDAIKFGYQKLAWGALRCNAVTDLQSDEEAVFSVTLRGKGKGTFGAGWLNGGGKFVVNGGGGAKFTLSDKPQTVTAVFRMTPDVVQKGGKRFYPSIFINAPGGEAIVEKASLTVRKKK